MSAAVYEDGVRLSDAEVTGHGTYGASRHYDIAVYDGGGYTATGHFDSETGHSLSGSGLVLMAEWP